MPLIMGILAQGVGAAPAAAGAYDLLETQVLASSASSVTFTGLDTLAAGYQHLQIRYVAKTDSASNLRAVKVNFNNDTGSNYAYHYLNGTGSSVISGSSTSDTYIQIIAIGNNNANQFYAGVVDILDFSNSSKNTTTRTLMGIADSSATQISLRSGLWNNTAAVTEIDLASFENFVTGSRFSLYGVR